MINEINEELWKIIDDVSKKGVEYAAENYYARRLKKKIDRYHEKYGFDTGEKNTTYNNEGDAFKHTFMQADLALRWTGIDIAKKIGNKHENDNTENDPRERNMDLWNNNQGRLIAQEINREHPNWRKLDSAQVDDIIAEKIMQRMNSGNLITDINSKKVFKESPEDKENVDLKEYVKQKIINKIKSNFTEILNKRSLEDQFIKNAYDIVDRKYNHPDLILSPEQYFDQKIRKQVMNKYYPHHNYDNGIDNGRWVTINGNHVFLKDKK